MRPDQTFGDILLYHIPPMFEIFGVKIDDISDQDLLKKILVWLESERPHMIFTPNPEFLLQAKKDEVFRSLLNQADLSLADGVGLKYAIAALTDERLVHRQTGIDTLDVLSSACQQTQKRLLLFGGQPGSASDAARVLKVRYPNLYVYGMDPGFIQSDHREIQLDNQIITEIQTWQPSVIAVALGQGKQERCCQKLTHLVSGVRITIGVGGALETISGKFSRAPKWMRRLGLEWFWRLLIEPRRAGRIFKACLIFPLLVIYDTLRFRRFWKAFFRVVTL